MIGDSVIRDKISMIGDYILKYIFVVIRDKISMIGDYKKRKIYFTLLLSFFIIVNFFLFGFARAEDVPSLTDPLKHRSVPNLVGDIIQYVLGIVGVLALVMFIYGGILWMTSGGSADKVKKGKDTIVWAVLGMVIVFFSYAIVNFVLKALLKE